MLERLPTPWGLVRGGVAPDHPKIKSVSRVYERTAAKPGFRFFGNVEVGTDVTPDELSQWYDAVVYALGAAADRRSGIPGETLPGSWSATEFVGWYNGHPDFRDLAFDLSCERAVIVGSGNVAIDSARMLALTRDELAGTDIADHALDALGSSAIREIVMLGRRGPLQAAFTNPELIELGELTDADVVVDDRDLAIADQLGDPPADATAQRNLEILRDYATRPRKGKRKRIVLRFLASPVELLGRGRVERVRVVRNRLERRDDGSLRAYATDEELAIDAGLVLRAIGYAGTPVAGLPFDHSRGVIANQAGRVVGPGGPLPGAYTAGWIKRGPSGVIGTNKKCASETVAALLDDAARRRLPTDGTLPADAVEVHLTERRPDLVTYAGWEAIDRHERGLGEPAGRPRVKLTRVGELLEAAASPGTGRSAARQERTR